MSYVSAILKHPDMSDAQRETMQRLVRAFGTPFAFSVVSGSALPTWQNIGTVSVRADGIARKIHNGQEV
jgi:hypothetical protein